MGKRRKRGEDEPRKKRRLLVKDKLDAPQNNVSKSNKRKRKEDETEQKKRKKKKILSKDDVQTLSFTKNSRKRTKKTDKQTQNEVRTAKDGLLPNRRPQLSSTLRQRGSKKKDPVVYQSRRIKKR